MRFVEPPSLGSPRRGHPGDGLDRLLSDFFRSEMPDPWPEPELPEQQPTLALPDRPIPRPRGLLRSRFALAASVALLVGGSWLLSGAFGTINHEAPSRAGTDGTADSKPDRLPRNFRIEERMFIDPSGNTNIRIDVQEEPRKSVGKQLRNQLP
jgi:hypothetical protein